MTFESAKILYAHKLAIGKPVDDLLKRFPELAIKEEVLEKEAELGKPKEKANGKTRKG